MTATAIYIDPPSPAYYADRLFDTSDPVLNRDDSLLPYAQLKANFETQGIEVHTADGLPQEEGGVTLDYYSLGVLTQFRQLAQRKDLCMRAFVIFEPPVVEPRLYRALPELTAAFERVYVHNVHGNGYSLKGVDVSRLRKLYWPQPRLNVIEPLWSNRDRMNRLVVINGNHKPQKVPHELYSQRIEAMAALAPANCIDLYGRGWSRWWSRTSMWRPYWKHRRALMSIYKGQCDSKYEVLSRYQFCLCLENMAMQGYVTEKLFDCLYAGTVPLYLGATDIAELVPPEAYIDCRQFASWQELHAAVKTLSAVQIDQIREAGRAFIESHSYSKYYGGLLPVFGIESAK